MQNTSLWRHIIFWSTFPLASMVVPCFLCLINCGTSEIVTNFRVKCLSVLPDLKKKNISKNFSKNSKYNISWKAVQWKTRIPCRERQSWRRVDVGIHFSNVSKRLCDPKEVTTHVAVCPLEVRSRPDGPAPRCHLRNLKAMTVFTVDSHWAQSRANIPCSLFFKIHLIFPSISLHLK